MTDKTAIDKEKTRSEKERDQQAAPAVPAHNPDLDDTLIREYLKIKHEISDYRTGAIKALPNFIVNNSSNVLAPIHIFGEVMMFKGSNNTLMDKKAIIAKHGAVSWHHYLTEPPKNIYNEIFKGGGIKGKLGDFLKPSFYADGLRNTFDLKRASEVDWSAAVEQSKKTGIEAKLVNRWQTRSTSLGILGWGLSIFVPEAREKPKEMEDMSRLYKENLPAYIGTRAWQAVDVTHWSDNKPQMTGGLVTLSGMCTMLSGFRNVDRNPATRVCSYRMNPSHSIMGIISTIGGLSMWFGTSKEESYKNFGSTMMGRLFFLPSSLGNRFKVKPDGSYDPGRWFYTAGQASFQTHNLANVLIGGAEKNEDGTIVDQKAITAAAKRQVVAERKSAGHRDEADHAAESDMPAVKIQHVVEHTPPVREAAQVVS